MSDLTKAKGLEDLTDDEIEDIVHASSMAARATFMYQPRCTALPKRPKPPKRARKPTLAAAVRQARAAGANVAGATIGPDGRLSLEFGELTTSNTDDDVENWLKKHAH